MSTYLEAPVEAEKPRLGTASVVVRFALIGVALAAVAGIFAYLGGWFTPNELTPARFTDGFEEVNGVHPGFRRNHARGVDVSGFFESNGNGVRLSKAIVFQPGRVPVLGRFSLGGGQPYAADTPDAVRGLGLHHRTGTAPRSRRAINGRAASVYHARGQPDCTPNLQVILRCPELQKGMPMSTPTQSRSKPAGSPSAVQSRRPGEAIGPKAWIAKAAKQPMVLETVDLGPLGAEDVEIAVEHCGLCHSDLSVLNNHWGLSQYPAILGHEAVGRVTAIGPNAKRVQVGQRVGVGWFSASDMHCRQCMSGNHHLCPQAQATIIGHRGAFASHVRVHWAWAFPLPEKLNFAEAGPLLCGGVTVFAPLARFAKPADRVGIIGIGGLGHMAVKFAAACGCDVTAFTASESKFDEARAFGANHVLTTRDSAAIRKLSGSLDLLISTVNVKLDWDALIGTLAPNGRLHVVGAVLEPIPVAAFSLIRQQRSVSGSPTGSPVAIQTMLDFASRHNIAPQTEHFPMSRINEAFARLQSGKARYRIVLDADF